MIYRPKDKKPKVIKGNEGWIWSAPRSRKIRSNVRFITVMGQFFIEIGNYYTL